MMLPPVDLRHRDPLQILISGTAGQGAVFSASLIAGAAALDGKYVSETARSSAAVRSGPSTAHVIISNAPIDFPFVDAPDIFIAFSRHAFETQASPLSRVGILFYDATLITEEPTVAASRRIGIEASARASEAGLPDANLVLLGAACHYTGFLSMDRLLAVIDTLDEPIRGPDRAALMLGRNLAKNLEIVDP